MVTELEEIEEGSDCAGEGQKQFKRPTDTPSQVSCELKFPEVRIW
jgi:hypothetical protein